MGDEKVLNKYKFIYDDDGYISGFYDVLDGDYDFYGQMADISEACGGWTKCINGEIVDDLEKKAEIIAENEKQEEIADLQFKLDGSDYIIARTFEDVMSLDNPITFIADFIRILKSFKTKYATELDNRKAWRERIEELNK